MKRRIYQSCIGSAMSYGSKTKFLKENKIARTEKALMRAMCGIKVIEKRSQELMRFLCFERYFGWSSQGKWSTMVWTCFEKR